MLPLPWCIALLAAAAFHEGCHTLALLLCGGRISRLDISGRGASILAGSLTPGQALLCTLAGPAGGLLLLPLWMYFPRLALCAGVQSVFNLLPVSGLDGGQALALLLSRFFPTTRADTYCRRAETATLLLVALTGIWGTAVAKLGLLPILAAGILILRANSRNTPCKYGILGVQ